MCCTCGGWRRELSGGTPVHSSLCCCRTRLLRCSCLGTCPRCRGGDKVNPSPLTLREKRGMKLLSFTSRGFSPTRRNNRMLCFGYLTSDLSRSCARCRGWGSSPPLLYATASRGNAFCINRHKHLVILLKWQYKFPQL